MKLFFCVLCLISLTAFADVLRIDSIDRGVNSDEPDHVYLSDGRVGIVPDNKSTFPEELLRVGAFVEITLDKNHNIIKMSPAKRPKLNSLEIPGEKEEYSPTIVSNLSEVNSIFRRMNRGWQRDSQCYNRAHIWNYEEFQKSGLKSKKVFIFFTRKYIRDYNFYWWFHAIPTVLANSEGNVVERYLDPRYARSPLTRKTWTDIFVRSRRDCPVVTRYSDYRNNQESEHCYLHFSSMYYWQPRDLERFERTGYEKKSFIRSEVNHAYWEAF